MTLFAVVSNRLPFNTATFTDATFRAFVRTTAPHALDDFVLAPWATEWAADASAATRLRWRWSRSFSPALVHLLSGCLAVRPGERLSMEEVIAHPWFSTPRWVPPSKHAAQTSTGSPGGVTRRPVPAVPTAEGAPPGSKSTMSPIPPPSHGASEEQTSGSSAASGQGGGGALAPNHLPRLALGGEVLVASSAQAAMLAPRRKEPLPRLGGAGGHLADSPDRMVSFDPTARTDKRAAALSAHECLASVGETRGYNTALGLPLSPVPAAGEAESSMPPLVVDLSTPLHSQLPAGGGGRDSAGAEALPGAGQVQVWASQRSSGSPSHARVTLPSVEPSGPRVAVGPLQAAKAESRGAAASGHGCTN